MELGQESDRPSKVRLFMAVICGNITSFALGTSIGWTSPMMPKLKNQHPDSPFDFKIGRGQEGWIFSLIAIGAGLFAYVAGDLADRYGRKTTMMLASFMFALSYTLMIFASHIEIMYAARILEGIGGGFTMTVLPMYVGEIATKESRGSAASLMMLFMTLGMLYVYSIGPYTEYVVFQVICLAIPLISIGGFLYIPESPHYLIMRGRVGEAAKALQRVRGQSLVSVRKEIPAIQEAVDRAKAVTKGRCADIINNPGNCRALIIVVGLMAFQQFSGAVIIVINSQSIFIQANSSLDSALSSIIVGVVQVLSSVTLQLIVDLWKRRTLLRLSAIGMGLAQFATGTFFYIQAKGDSSQIRWIPIAAFIVFQLAYRIGFGPLPFTILSELFPPNIKSIAASSVTLTCWGLGFLISKFYPHLDAFGSYYIFWAFSILCAAAFLFPQFVVIETHGLSLKEIQDRLQEIK